MQQERGIWDLIWGQQLRTAKEYQLFRQSAQKTSTLTDSRGFTFMVPVAIHFSLMSPVLWLRGLQD